MVQAYATRGINKMIDRRGESVKSVLAEAEDNGHRNRARCLVKPARLLRAAQRPAGAAA